MWIFAITQLSFFLLFYVRMQSDSLPQKNINYLGFWEASVQENVRTWDGGGGGGGLENQ